MVTHNLEHIAAAPGGFSKTAFAAAAVDDVFTRDTEGRFDTKNFVHCPSACGLSSDRNYARRRVAHLLMTHDCLDVRKADPFPDKKTVLDSQGDFSTHESKVVSTESIVGLDYTSEDRVLLRHNTQVISRCNTTKDICAHSEECCGS